MFQDIHEGRTWVLMSSLSEEAQAMLRCHFSSPSSQLARTTGRPRHFVFEDPYHLETGLLFHLFLDDEVALQLLVARCTAIPGDDPTINTERALHHIFGHERVRNWTIRRMLRNGDISPRRYRELRSYVQKHFAEDSVR